MPPGELTVSRPFRRSSVAALLLPLALAACGDSGGGANAGAEVPEAERYGGTATIGLFGDISSLNSLTSSDANANNVMRDILLMTLVKYDEQLNPVPYLAESWDTVRVAGDSLDLTFRLRRDVKWHDGQPTTAEDVRFTFERAITPETAFPNISGFAEYSRSVQLVDPYTIRFRLRPHSDFLDIWYQTAIMPEHLLGDVPPAQLLNHPFGTTSPTGNGPFRFVRRVPNVEWVFEANPDFPEALGGRPYLDRVVIRVVPEMTTLLTELLTGSIDMYVGANPDQAAQIEAAPNTRLVASPYRQWVFVGLNTRRPMFRDARVRRAIGMAINRQEIVDALLFGYGEIARGTLTPAHWAFDREDPRTVIPYDTAGARRLLAEAGWVDRDRDGILENAQGADFRFEVITNQGNEVREDILEIVQADLRPLGIVAQPRLVEWNTMRARLQEREREFDAVVSGWVNYFRQDDRDILHSRHVDAPYQYVGYSNPRADVLMDTLAVITDREQARPLWKEWQRILTQDAPYIPLYIPQRLNGLSERLQGVDIDVRGEWISIKDWWILPSQRGGSAAPAPAPADSAATE